MEKVMTIESSLSKIRYIGNGVTTTFSIPFAYLTNNDGSAQLAVYIGDSDTPLTEGKDYTIVGLGQAVAIDDDVEFATYEERFDGGDVVFEVAPEQGVPVAVVRNVPQTQGVVFVEGEKFPAQDFENALDKLTMEVQEIKENLQRAIVLPPTSTEKPIEARDAILLARDEAKTAAEQAQIAADNATSAVEETEQQLADTKVYVDSAKADIANTADNATGEITAAKDAAINAVEAAKIEIDNTKNSAIGTINSTVLTAETDIDNATDKATSDIASTVTQAKADINTAVDEATMSISDTSTGAINTINTAVSNAEGNISTIVSDAEGSITNIAVTEANKAIANAAQEATDTATANVNNYVNGTILPPLQTYVNQAQEDANSAATSMEQAALSATAASNYASNASADADNAAESAALASADAGSAARSAELAQQIKDSLGSVYVYKGSVNNYSDLPSGATTGDVYNVVSNGKNYAWTGSAWDDLGGTVDLSEYQKTADADSKYATKTSLNSLSSAVSENSSNITSLQGSKQDIANLSQTLDTSTTKYPSNKAVVDYSAKRHQVVSVLPVNPDADTFYYITEE